MDMGSDMGSFSSVGMGAAPSANNMMGNNLMGMNQGNPNPNVNMNNNMMMMNNNNMMMNNNMMNNNMMMQSSGLDSDNMTTQDGTFLSIGQV